MHEINASFGSVKTINIIKAIDTALWDRRMSIGLIAFETTKLRVSVMQYNEGQKKLQVSRENLDNDSGDWRWSKLGRMTKEESEKVVPAMVKALENM